MEEQLSSFISKIQIHLTLWLYATQYLQYYRKHIFYSTSLKS
jgi:hypothetical protein